MSELAPEEQHTLQFLRSRVDEAEMQAFRTKHHRDISADLLRAREELRLYVERLREAGRAV